MTPAVPARTHDPRLLDEIKTLGDQKDAIAATVRARRDMVDGVPKQTEALRAVRLRVCAPPYLHSVLTRARAHAKPVGVPRSWPRCIGRSGWRCR